MSRCGSLTWSPRHWPEMINKGHFEWKRPLWYESVRIKWEEALNTAFLIPLVLVVI